MLLVLKRVYCIVYIIFILKSSSSQTVKSPTNSAQIQNLIQSKTICLFELAELDDYQTISCPINYKISVINAILFDTARNLTECLPMTKSDKFIKMIKNELQDFCTDYNCSITKEFLINLLLNEIPVINNLSLDVNWQCFMTTSTYAVINAPTATYSFTYFFYIVTLVLSTSCILIGAIFILRKFLVLRRRNRGFLHARTNRGFISEGINNINRDVSTNNIIWMTACPPPAYENIYDSSFSVNRLPDYSSTILKAKTQKENESNLLNSNSLQTQSQQQQPQLNGQQEQSEQQRDFTQQEHLNLNQSEQVVQISDTAIDSNLNNNNNNNNNNINNGNSNSKEEFNSNDIKIDK